MPKELIHFTIAEKTAQRLEGSRFARPVSNQKEGLLLGSVFHDALFYAVLPGCRPLERLAHKLHGARGQDTFNLIRFQADHILSSANKDLACAILVGLVSHLYADSVMHPFVWHYTGDYYADNDKRKSLARQRHRALESLMDMVACPEKVRNKKYYLRTLIQQTPDIITNGLPIKRLAQETHTSPEEVTKGLEKSWQLYQTLQRLFPIPYLARLLFSLRKVTPDFFTELTMLFYCPQLLKQGDKLQESITFRHPVTRKEKMTTLSGLIDQAAIRAAELCLEIEDDVFSGRAINLSQTGPSMDSGLKRVSTAEMTTFSKTPYPDIS
ncbi:conserved protein of unknown function [Pseudodesulfovibrio profundus]|uniref:Phospholipase C/D domain-containing protein n=1 Tax=Pseudodesulfovibrio profundus TaxID=57320 RepID=A0A2C8FE64_9BACT|nr:zinc dependent phospholipase C family protein [Pseudodesulfovibrio profundus]SOB60945.1 conserved protein of unknown function [Pseudodesulfovibrio profundus]